MTVLFQLPYNEQECEAIWPRFRSSLTDKHGFTGTTGDVAESQAVEHLTQIYKPSFIIDCNQSALHQMMGIDIILRTDDDFLTFDIKGGRSPLSWDGKNQSWFIKFNAKYFDQHKKNNYIYHQSIKGDFYCYYNKQQMYDWYITKTHLTGLLNPHESFDETHYKIYKRHWPDFLTHNLG